MPFRAIARRTVDAYHLYREDPIFNAAVNTGASALTYGALRNSGELVKLVTGIDSQELNTLGDILVPISFSALLSYSLDHGPLPANRFLGRVWRGLRDSATAGVAGLAGVVATSDLMDYKGSEQAFQLARDLYYHITAGHPYLASFIIGAGSRAFQLSKRYGRERNAEIRAARVPNP